MGLASANPDAVGSSFRCWVLTRISQQLQFLEHRLFFWKPNNAEEKMLLQREEVARKQQDSPDNIQNQLPNIHKDNQKIGCQRRLPRMTCPKINYQKRL